MKKRIRNTGEIVDVISYNKYTNTARNYDLDWVSYIDSKGREYEHEKGLNIYWDFEDVEAIPGTNIDWEQRRYEVAKDMLSMFLHIGGYNELIRCLRNNDVKSNPYQGFAEASVQVADALIAELRKGGEK